jgi:ribosome-associated toxin RatA of RatAB toxin-antitoxin module
MEGTAMRRVIIRVLVPGRQPRQAYERISDFPRYEELTSTVRKVVMHPAGADGSIVSEWTVTFRNGVLCWTERDFFDADRLAIRFVQLTGDFERFDGQWQVTDGPRGTQITFDAVFDLGMPSLTDILDPVAEATLRDNILVILRGLLGDVTVLSDEPADADEPTVAIGELARAGHD